METITVKEYINVDRMIDELERIYKDEVESYRNDERTEEGKWYLDEHWDEDQIREYAIGMALGFNEDMKTYLNSEDHRICGNFNNIEYDYPYFRNGEVEYDIPLVKDLIKRLNDGDMSEQTIKDRDWLVDWFFETFGTYGIAYNFSSMLSEDLYCIEEKNN